MSGRRETRGCARKAAAAVTWLALLVSAAFFARTLCGADMRALLTDHARSLLFLVPLALLVQLLKAARMYVIFIDTELAFADHLLYYAQSTLVSIAVPYKLGELFRIYRYGNAVGDYLGGAARVLVDRLADTAALLTLLTGMLLLGRFSVIPLYFALVAFTLLACAMWLAFPSVYRFWNDYLIVRRHSARAGAMLSAMQRAEKVYRYLRTLLRGKLFVMFLLSLAAWGLELLGVLLLAGARGDGGALVGEYLRSALSAGTNEAQRLYAALYIALLACVIAALLVRRALHNRAQKRKERV